MHISKIIRLKLGLFAAMCLGSALSLHAQTLIHRYSFNDAPGSSSFADSVGSASGTLNNATAVNPNSASLDGSQLQLDGTGGYGLLPSGMVSGNTQVTIEFWGSFSPTNAIWTRVFAFGDQNGSSADTSLDYCHYAGGNYQNLNYQTAAGGGYANNPSGLNGATNAHVTVIVDPVNSKMYYYNGSTLVSSISTSVPPLSGLIDTYGLIGRSLYDVDPVLSGSINEFRIYSGVVPVSVVALDDASGPDSILTSPGTLQSLNLTTSSSTMAINGNAQLNLAGNFSSVSNLNLINYGGASFASANSSIITVNSTNGLVHAVAAGSTMITATYGSLSTNITISVASIPASLAHRYSFTSDASDAIGGANGTINGTASISGGQLILDGNAGSYVSLPGNIININTNFAITLEAWCTIGATNSTWARLFEFGDGIAGDNDLFSAPQVNGGYTHWSIAANYPPVTVLDQSQSWDGTTAHHTWVINPATGQLESYINGVLEYSIQSDTGLLSGIATNVAWLGHSPFSADPYLYGSIDEFRIYSGALTPQEIAMSDLSGPNNTNRSPGALVSINVPTKNVPAYSSLFAPTILANYVNLTNFSLIPVTTTAPVSGLTLTSSDTNILAFNGNDMCSTFRPGKVTVTATYQGMTASGTIYVKNLGVLAHRYSFVNDASDSVGAANGTLNGDATVSGGSLALDGTSGTYLSLPSNLFSNYNAVTIDTWVTLNAGATWARLWFFGDNQANEFYVAPNTVGGSDHRVSSSIRDGFNADDAPAWQNQTIHITTVYGNGSAELYSNGVPVRVFTGLIGGLNQVGPSLAWIGRSPYNDPYLNCNVDEFRIYKGRLSPDEIAASDLIGPNQLLSTNATMNIQQTGGNSVLVWPAAAAGFALQTSTNLLSGWTTLTNAPSLNGTNWQISIPNGSTTQFFRLWR